MTVEFALITSDHGDQPFTDEAEIFSTPEKFTEFLGPKERTHIARIMLKNDPEEEISFIDEMWHVGMDLCFEAIAGLSEGNDYVYKTMMTGQPVQFQPSGENIKVTNTDGNVIVFPKTDLLVCLYHCGFRYLDLIALLPPLGHEKNAAFIRNYQLRAAEVLKEYGILP